MAIHRQSIMSRVEQVRSDPTVEELIAEARTPLDLKGEEG